MEWHFTPYAFILIVIGLLLSIITYRVWRRRKIPGGTTFALLMVAATELCFSSALEIAVVGVPAKTFWARIEYLGNQSAPVLFLIFALEYSYQNNWLRYRNTIFLWIMPIITIMMVATNGWHRLVWTSFTPNPDDISIIIYGHGIWFWICTVYGFLLSLIGWIILLRTAIRSPRLFRRQIGILIATAIIPGLGSAIYLVGLNPIVGFDTAPITLALTGIILSGNIFGFGLFDLLPIARNILVENMSDSVIVLDEKDCIVDINLAAKNYFSPVAQLAVGKPIDTILETWPELLEKIRDVQETHTEICLSKETNHYLELAISTLHDHRKRYAGRIILLHDITELRQMQESLKSHAEELSIINRVNQAIVSGIDLDYVLKSLHRQCALVAPIDVFYIALYDVRSSIIKIPLYYEKGQYRTGLTRDIQEQPGNIGKVISERRMIYLRDVKKPFTGPLLSKSALSSSVARSYVGIPLLLRDGIIGALVIQSYKPNAYTERQINLLETITLQAAIAISNACLHAEVQRLAIMDELTNLYNYRGLIALGAREIERARRFSHPLSVLFFDIDNFRACNNRYSHVVGNQILQAIAQYCQSNMRLVDVVARYGGDEFVILLPETDLATAKTVADRLAKDIACLHISTKKGLLKVTVSIGVTEFNEDIKDIFNLIDRVNLGEHQAKKAGGNCMVVVVD